MLSRPLESVENIETYHEVFAASMREVIALISRKDTDQAKVLIKYNIWYALSMWMVDENAELTPEKISKEITKLDLDHKQLPELVVLMTFYQSKAGLKPVQERDLRARMFERFVNANK
jgi:hypothetical protein